jgi:hypothetical protein
MSDSELREGSASANHQPAALPQSLHFELEQRPGTFDPVPVLIQVVAPQLTVFLESNFPPEWCDGTNRIVSGVLSQA